MSWKSFFQQKSNTILMCEFLIGFLDIRPNGVGRKIDGGQIHSLLTMPNVITLVFILIAVALALEASGTIKTDKNWFVVEKFCYKKGKGELIYEFDWEGKNNQPDYTLAFLYDIPGEWGKVAKNPDMKCEDVVNLARGYRTPVSGNTDEEFFTDSVPNYWYFILANCAKDNINGVKYEISAYNPGPESQKQFSCDWQGIEAIFIISTFFSLILIGVHTHTILALRQADSYHNIIKLITVSLLLFFFGLLSIVIHLSKYASDGIGAWGLFGFGEILLALSFFALMWFAFLISKGYTITTTEIPDRKQLLAIVSVGQLGILISLIVAVSNRENEFYTYIWETAGGFVALAFRSILGVVCGFYFYKTCTEETDNLKLAFFQRFGIFLVSFFLLLPIIVIFSFLSPLELRMRFVFSMDLVLSTALFSGLLWLFWPTRAAEYFKISPPDLIAGVTPYDSI